MEVLAFFIVALIIGTFLRVFQSMLRIALPVMIPLGIFYLFVRADGDQIKAFIAVVVMLGAAALLFKLAFFIMDRASNNLLITSKKQMKIKKQELTENILMKQNIQHKKLVKVYKVSEIRKNIDKVERYSGVYKFFVDKQGLSLLEDVVCNSKSFANNKEIFFIYVGIAKDMNYRIKWHLGFVNVAQSNILNSSLSTLRFSLMANHKYINCLSQQKELNDFMDNHMYIQYLITEDYANIERDLIDEDKPPLNIKDNSNPFVDTNRMRRYKILDEYRNKQLSNVQEKIDIDFIPMYYGHNGKFINVITESITKIGNKIVENNLINIDLGVSGGYVANNILIQISKEEKVYYTNLILSDQSRFPARVKNLAMVLKNLKLYGTYSVSHNNGLLSIQRLQK